MLQTGLSLKGYSVRKEDLTLQEIENLKNELTVNPFNMYQNNQKIEFFKIYQENKNKLYLPKVYGLKKFGIPKTNKLAEHIKPINIEFKGTLRPEQHEPVNKFLEACKDPLRQGGVISVHCGGGKCLGKDTPVLLYSGHTKLVQDITFKDILMGDDSTPRQVLSICGGQEKLYRINQGNIESYVVNESHLLALKSRETYDVRIISVKDYLEISKESKAFKDMLHGYRVSICFPYQRIFADPYLYGYMLFDPMYNNTYLLDSYKYNAYTIRIAVLDGIIQYQQSHTIIHKNEKLIDDVVYLTRSLGYHAIKQKYKSYYVITIRITADPSSLLTPISVEPIGIGNYYGFEISGNGRFVLGNFTVTHNTTMAIYLMSQLKVKTMVIVHKEFLLQQWKERIEQFAPNARIGLLKAQTVDIIDKDIVMVSLQSLSMKEYTDDIFKEFGFTIYDECHHASAENFSQALRKVNTQYSLGLSATPKRKDGLTKVFLWHLGNIVYTSSKRYDNVDVDMVYYYDRAPEYSQEEYMYKGKLNISRMVNKICDYEPRVRFIINLIKTLLEEEPDRKIIILSDRRNHIDRIIELVRSELKIAADPYYGGLKEKVLKEAETKQIIGGTFSMAAEGLDVRGLDTLILASPKTDIIQSVGRILREKAEERKYVPKVIDIVDNFSIFVNQSKKRADYYKKAKYNVNIAEASPLHTNPENAAALVLDKFVIEDLEADHD